MVWQRAGTVAVQNGSNTVIGTNVDFAASSRNGDSFVGPDGATYEVANVASSTVISILPAYKGPTVAGAAYAIMPVQGYDKMLSDAFNNLNNQFGPKLAALGTTGNYDVLPVTKGGTGGAGAASARVGLGLGTAATANVTSSNTSGIPGEVLQVGDFGIGGAVPYLTNLDLNSFISGGLFFCSGPVNGPSSFSGWLINSAIDSKYCSQVFTVLNTRYAYSRIKDGGTWSVWSLIYTSLNTTKAADGTLKAI